MPSRVEQSVIDIYQQQRVLNLRSLRLSASFEHNSVFVYRSDVDRVCKSRSKSTQPFGNLFRRTVRRNQVEPWAAAQLGQPRFGTDAQALRELPLRSAGLT